MDSENQIPAPSQPIVGGGSRSNGLGKLAWLLVVVIAGGSLWAGWSIHTKKSNVVKPLGNQIAQRRDQQSGDKEVRTSQAVTVGDLKLTFVSLGRIVSSAETTPTSADSNLQYVSANIALEGLAGTAANFSLNNFSLLTDSTTSTALGATSLPLGITSPLGSGSLKKGEKTTGQVVFLLPAKYKYYYVVFTPQNVKHERLIVSQ